MSGYPVELMELWGWRMTARGEWTHDFFGPRGGSGACLSLDQARTYEAFARHRRHETAVAKERARASAEAWIRGWNGDDVRRVPRAHALFTEDVGLLAGAQLPTGPMSAWIVTTDRGDWLHVFTVEDGGRWDCVTLTEGGRSWIGLVRAR